MGNIGRPFDAKVLNALKKAVLKNPKMSFAEFNKDNPNAGISATPYLRYRFKYVSEVGRADELPLRTGYDKPCDYKYRDRDKQNNKRKYIHRNKLYSAGWRYPVKEFQQNPLKAFQNFIETFSANGRANFELLKIEVCIDNKWVPHYEIRESQ